MNAKSDSGIHKDLLFADAHFHSNPLKGYGAEYIVRKFKESGGWFMALVGLPPTSLGLLPNEEGFEKSLEVLLRECEKAKRVEGIKIVCLGGYHPGMIDKMIDFLKIDPQRVYNISVNWVKHVANLIKRGLLDGLAEIGRPHYKVSPEHMVLAENIFESVLEIAKDYDLLIHLHLEEGGWITAYDIYRKIHRYSLNPWRIVMHHAKPKNLRPSMELGLVATVPALYQIIENIKDIKIINYVYESDFLDDPERPGRPMYPWEIISNSIRALNEGVVDKDILHIVNIDNIVKIYGVEPP